jgi:hypothetical protein
MNGKTDEKKSAGIVVNAIGTSYEEILSLEGVIVKVPSGELKIVEGIGDMKSHKRFGMLLETNLILNCHFYGVEVKDAGKKVICNVIMRKKTLQNGREFTIIDYTKVSDFDDEKAFFKLKIENFSAKDPAKSVEVIGSAQGKCLNFYPCGQVHSHAQPKVVVKADEKQASMEAQL